MNKTPWRCACAATNTWATAFCELCGDARPADEKAATVPAATTSCWTCDACGTRTPGQPVLYQADGPGGAPRGLCSGCHFDLRIRPTVRAPIEEVHANVIAIGQMVDRLTRRMETVTL